MKSKRKYVYNGYTFRKNPRSIYADYVKKYKYKRNYLADNYSAEMNVPMLRYKEWKETYIAKHNDQIKEVKAGIRKNTGAINQELVSEQAYEYSQLQAKRLVEAAKRYAKSPKDVPSITAIRLGNVDWDAMKKYYHELRDGLSGKEAGKSMSWYFFGSK